MADGTLPAGATAPLKAAFARFADFVRRAYAGVKGSVLEKKLDPAVRAYFDERYGGAKVEAAPEGEASKGTPKVKVGGKWGIQTKLLPSDTAERYVEAVNENRDRVEALRGEAMTHDRIRALASEVAPVWEDYAHLKDGKSLTGPSILKAMQLQQGLQVLAKKARLDAATPDATPAARALADDLTDKEIHMTGIVSSAVAEPGRTLNAIKIARQHLETRPTPVADDIFTKRGTGEVLADEHHWGTHQSAHGNGSRLLA